GVVSGETACDLWPDIPKASQFAFVELLEDASLYLPLKAVTGRDEDVVTRFSRKKFCFERLIGVEGVVLHLDAGLLRDIFEDLRFAVIRPIIDVDHAGVLRRDQIDRSGAHHKN